LVENDAISIVEDEVIEEDDEEEAPERHLPFEPEGQIPTPDPKERIVCDVCHRNTMLPH